MEASRGGGANRGGKQAHLGKLEDVFLAVYDLEAAPREPGAHIPSVHPTLLVQHLISLLLVLVVPLEDDGAPHTDLPEANNASYTCINWRFLEVVDEKRQYKQLLPPGLSARATSCFWGY